MNPKKTDKQLVPLLRESVNTYVSNPVILIPFLTVAFVQLLILEIIYFSPRFPLVKFFGPLIQRLEGEAFLHYPQNFIILPKWFQTAQYFIYVFIGSFLIAVAIALIAQINNSRKPAFGSALRETLSQYVHIVLAAALAFVSFFTMAKGYGLLIDRALLIRSESGIFYILKAVILHGAPYFNLLIGVLVTAIFAFLYPIIVIDRKKIFSALVLNFRHLFKSFWFICFTVMIPTLFYVPVLLLRNNLGFIQNITFEGIQVGMIILSIVVMMFIDATVYTAVTTYYLLKKETT